jgi:hypothetical protein
LEVTMLRIVPVLLALLLPGAAVAQLTLMGVGGGYSGGGGGGAYVGPGDKVSGASMWWGLRAYSAAAAGTRAANICNSGDANCADINTLSNGNFDVVTAQGAPLSCGGSGGTCTIKTMYDQTGALACAGSTACDVTQATIANRPTLVFSCIGSLPCAAFARSGPQGLVTAASFTRAQPASAAFVGERTATFTSIQTAIGGGGSLTLIGWANNANILRIASGTNIGLGSADSVFHAVQGTWSSTVGALSADGSSNTGQNTGATGFSVAIGFGSNNAGANGMDGRLTEGGIWPLAFTTQNISDLNSNAHSYWGF